MQGGVERPILFYSKVFNEVQSRWSVSDKEMYSIVHGVLSNHYLLMGRPFTIRSDHKALMFNEKISASNKIERWKVSLSEYDIRWKFIEGSNNVVADALSRVIDTTPAFLETDDLDPEPFTVLVLNEISTSTIAAIDDPETVTQAQYQQDLIRTHHSPLHFDESDPLSLLHWKKDKIKTHHSPAHFNSHDTFASLQHHKYDWRGMRQMVDDFASKCRICQMFKTRTNPGHSGSFTLKASRPGEKICFDVLEYEEDFHGFNFILVIVDCFNSYATLVPLKNIRAGDIFNALIKYFCDDGIPDAATFDKGASLNAETVTALLRFLHVNNVVTTARSSEENGIAEQKIKMVRQVMSILLEEQHSSFSSGEVAWSSMIPFTQRALNIMAVNNGHSPAELRFGIHNKLDAIKIPLIPPEMLAEQSAALQNEQIRQEKKLSKKQVSELSIFKINELVIIKNPTHLKRNPAHRPYLGPFKVTAQTITSLTLTLVSNPTIIKVVKNSEAFRYKDSEISADQVGSPQGLKLVPNVPLAMDTSK